MKKSTFILLSFFISSCYSGSNFSAYSSPENNTTATKANQIMFLFFEVEKDINGNEVIEMVRQQITEGTVKNEYMEEAKKEDGNFVVSLLDESGKTVKQFIVENPLTPVLEYYSEEGMGKQKMNFDRGEFSLRINFAPNIQEVKIEKISSQNHIELQTIKL